MIFNTWEWHVKNDQQYGGLLQNVMTFLHYWRMPLLFLISGAGTYFALGKRTSAQYLGERFKRLFIPFIVGVFTLVPVQVYIEKTASYSSLPDFYNHMFEGLYPEGNFSWHHLWFIVYLFVIALFISPFLNMLRSERFSALIIRIERFIAKPLALNVLLIPLLLSQIILREYYEVNTNDLVNDGASMALYIIFFLSGFVLLPNKNIADSIREQRQLYLAETFVITFIMFWLPPMVGSEHAGEIIWDVCSIVVALTCGLTALGYAKQYLNHDSKFRKLANEAIFPFYLLHQPVIVVIGYFVVGISIPVLLKAVLITLSSFSIITGLYWLIIRRNNFLRLIFGMKMIRKEKQENEASLVLSPVIAETNTMKTQTKTRKLNLNVMISVMIVVLIFLSKGAVAQEEESVRSLFKENVTVNELWTPEVKINSIQGNIGTLVGFYGGALINRTVLVGITGGVNLGHPRVNYGYFGGMVQYIFNPSEVVHYSGQMILAYGTTKDYENPKSGLLDNFWNISGAPFFMMEPGLNIEANLSRRITLVAGMSYRYVSGLEENNENVQVTMVTNKDLSGLNFNIGLKFMKRQTK
jgi:fucose 4-O-acetylase-like acetyltransferase